MHFNQQKQKNPVIMGLDIGVKNVLFQSIEI